MVACEMVVIVYSDGRVL